jgi:MYXO-CTERM domain-containing protein
MLARTVVGAFASLAIVSSLVRDAKACTYPPPGWHASLQTQQVPTDGFVLFTHYCSFGCDSPPEPTVVVRDPATGSEIVGSVSPLADLPASLHAFAWRATEALAAGNYDIEIQLAASRHPASFQAVAPVVAGFDAVTVTAEIDVRGHDGGETTCCPTGPLDSCGGKLCYTSAVRRSIALSVQWASASAPAHFDQYLYRFMWEGSAPDSWQIPWLGGASEGRFDTPAADYCYTLELKSLHDGSIATVDRRCLPHLPDAELGLFDLAPEEIQNSLGRCEEPPEGLRADWCEARTTFCAELGLTPCTGLETHCADIGRDAGTGDLGDPGDPGDEGPSDLRTIRTEGCAVARPGSPSHGLRAAMLLIAAVGAALARRRRRPLERLRER